MKHSSTNIINLVISYNGLLQRYVQRIIKNDLAVTLVVTNTFEKFYNESKLQPHTHTRQLLQACAINACMEWFNISVRMVNNSSCNGSVILQQDNDQLQLVQNMLAGKAERGGFTNN